MPTAALDPSEDGDLNRFNYGNDENGEKCPFASRIRRANPRADFQVGPLTTLSAGECRSMTPGAAGIFMAYNASIAEHSRPSSADQRYSNSRALRQARTINTGVAPRAALSRRWSVSFASWKRTRSSA